MFKHIAVLGMAVFTWLAPAAEAAPVVTLAAPAANAKYAPPATITVSANASDSDSSASIAKVDFYAGTTLIGTATTAPYTVNWNNVPVGSYNLTAKATSSQNLTATSAAVKVTVNTAPTVTLTAPATGTGYAGLATVNLAADAGDADGNLTKVDFYRGSTLVGTAAAAPYATTMTGVQPGTYSITARATDSLGAVTISTASTITVTNPITVAMTSPANNATFAPPATIALTADASDSNGTISKVEFYNGTSTLIGTATGAPYTVNWSNVASGKYIIVAKATDSQGITKFSAAINVLVDSAPVVSLASPANNSTYSGPASIALAANVSDSDGTISKVQFMNGSTVLATLTAPPYTYQWNSVPAGNYTLRVIATDNLGLAATSDPVSVTVGADTPPNVNLTTPAANQTFVAPANIVLHANASDSGGSIAKVEFFQGATLVGTVTEAPYSYLWSNVPAGSYTLTAKATDNGGNTTTSGVINISVVANQLPTVSVSASPTEATAPATIGLSASASDNDGTIAKIEFFQGDTLLGTVSSAPYAYNWTSVAAGTYSITAKATDDRGGSATSAAVSVTVAGSSSQVYYIHADHLNTPRLITDSANNTVWQWENSDPFGNNVPAANNGFEFNLRFPGQYFDRETNLHYNYFRDYDPATGRYIQSDPIGLEGGINTYLYANAAPTMYTDPLGLNPAIAIQGAGGGVVAGGIAGSGQGTTVNGTGIDPITDMPIGIPPSSRSSGINVPASFCLMAPSICAAIAIANADSGKDFWNDLDRCRGSGTRTNGEKGRKRRYYEWDHTHGDVEVYNDRGEHLGSADPQTGEMTKPPVPGRKIDR